MGGALKGSKILIGTHTHQVVQTSKTIGPMV